MEIELNRGVDEILFGMTESNIIDLIGPPNKIVLDGYGNRDLIYNKLELVLKIELENGSTLGWIEVHNRESRWNDINPWILKRAEFLDLLSTNLEDFYESEDYGYMESYSFCNQWVELQYEFDSLTSFNFGSCK